IAAAGRVVTPIVAPGPSGRPVRAGFAQLLLQPAEELPFAAEGVHHLGVPQAGFAGHGLERQPLAPLAQLACGLQGPFGGFLLGPRVWRWLVAARPKGAFRAVRALKGL